MPKTENALQQHGFFHGGVITSLADTAAGLAGCSVLTD
jgi:acyl-coenzyme A thioesterase PaaI-like protein